jgi:16S rRNA (guanine966-N2)-methyltransferase
MRIVGGRWRGRSIKAPSGTLTRPTTDRVREAIFSAIESRLSGGFEGVAVLDAFAGSGALGLEALSRGASSATFVERDRKALESLRANIASLGAAESAKVVAGDVFTLAERGIGVPFALILLDPPYTLDPAKVHDLLATMAARETVSEEALVTWEHPSGLAPDWPEGYVLEARKRYGTTEVDIARFERRSDA